MIHKPKYLVTRLKPIHQEAPPPLPSPKPKAEKSFYTKVYEKLNQPINKSRFLAFACHIMGVDKEDLALEMMRSCGLWVDIQGEDILCLSTQRGFSDCEFCFVDIETTGSKPNVANIIEIGAIKVKNNEIIDRFESLVYAKEVPEEITDLTGISAEMLSDAPSEKKVLKDFRAFLGDSVFVAHNVAFDYGFISARLESHGDFGLLNPRICSVEFAQKTILSPRYSLAFLNEFLGINAPVSHRAYHDAYACKEVFNIASLMLPKDVVSLQDVIEFTRGKKL